MKWRLQEGEGEAIYEIGVEDNGMFVGLTREELDSSLNTLNVMASKLGAHTTLLRRHVVENVIDGPSRQVAEVLIRRVPDDQQVSKVLWSLFIETSKEKNKQAAKERQFISTLYLNPGKHTSVV